MSYLQVPGDPPLTDVPENSGLEIDNKAIIEFGFRRIWRILQISEGVIHLGVGG